MNRPRQPRRPRRQDAHGAPAPAGDRVAAALVTAISQARWPDGSLLVDLHPDVIRKRLAPHLTTALTQQRTQGQP